MTRPELAECLALLAECYPGRDVTAATATAYLAVLGDLPGKAVKDSVLRLIATSKFWPTVAEIREDVARAAMAIPDSESILAEVLGAIHDRGWCKPPKHGDLSPVAEAVVATAGWDTLCQSENPEALRAHVMRLAATYGRRAVESGNLASLGLLPATPCAPVAAALPERVGDVVKGLLPSLAESRAPSRTSSSAWHAPAPRQTTRPPRDLRPVEDEA